MAPARPDSPAPPAAPSNRASSRPACPLTSRLASSKVRAPSRSSAGVTRSTPPPPSSGTGAMAWNLLSAGRAGHVGDRQRHARAVALDRVAVGAAGVHQQPADLLLVEQVGQALGPHGHPCL